MKSKISLKKFLPYLPESIQESITKKISTIEIQDPYIKRLGMVGDLTIYKDEERIVLATISKLSLDRDREVIISDGIDVSEYEKNPIILLNHNWTSLPVGKALYTKTYSDRIRQKIQFDEDEESINIFKKFQSGSLRSFSIGFLPVKIVESGSPEFGKHADYVIQAGFMNVKDVDNTLRFITKGILLENSVVTIPSNLNAVAEAISDTESDPEVEMIESCDHNETDNVVTEIEEEPEENKSLENKITINPIIKYTNRFDKLIHKNVDEEMNINKLVDIEIYKSFGGI